MQIDLDALPSDAAVLQQMLRTMLHQQRELHAENDKLRLLIQRLVRHQFGRRSEQLSPDQLQFGLEELEQTIAANQAAQETATAGLTRQPRAKPSGRNHGALPAHLPRYSYCVIKFCGVRFAGSRGSEGGCGGWRGRWRSGVM